MDNEKDKKNNDSPQEQNKDKDLPPDMNDSCGSEEEYFDRESEEIEPESITDLESEDGAEESDSESEDSDSDNDNSGEKIEVSKDEVILGMLEEDFEENTEKQKNDIGDSSGKPLAEKKSFFSILGTGVFIAFCIILAGGAILRFIGLHFGLPGTFRPDEEYYVHTIFGLNSGDMNPHFFYYPSFYFYFNLCLWRVYEMWAMFTKVYEPANGANSFISQHTHTMYLLGRYVGAVLGSLTIIVTYFIGRRYYGYLAGILAALFLAFNPVHALNSHFFKSDVATTFFMTVSLFFMFEYLKAGKKQHIYWAAVFAGISFSTNYYGGFLMIPLCTTLLLRAVSDRKLLLSYEFYLAPCLMILSFILLSPFIFIDWQTFMQHFARMLHSDRVNLYNTLVISNGYKEDNFDKPLIYSITFCLRHTTGVALAVFSLISVLALSLSFRKKNLMIVVFLLSYFFLIATGKAVFTRYYAPIAPILSLICAITLAYILTWIWKKSKAAAVVLGIILTAGFIIEPLYVTYKQTMILKEKDTRIQAQEWMAKELPPSTTIASLLDYRYGKPVIAAGGRYVKFEGNIENLYRSGVRYILNDVYALKLYSPEFNKAIQSQIQEKTELIKVFSYSPESEKEKPVVDVCDAFYLPMHRFGKIERPGPEIRIYKILPEKLNISQATESPVINQPMMQKSPDVPDKTQIEPVPEEPQANQNGKGLRGLYFNNIKQEGEPSFTRIDAQVNFDWSGKSPKPGFTGSNYSVIWEGFLSVPDEDSYTFYLESDDGSKLWIDDETIISNWAVQAPREMTAMRLLKEGVHPIRVVYFQESFGSIIKLSWSSSKIRKSIISSEFLKTTSG